MKHAVIRNLLKHDKMVTINVEATTSLSPGTGITIWSKTQDTILGSTMLGERGISSEEIGKTAALNLLSEIDSRATLDVYAFDQLLPYMALALENGRSICYVREMSNHAKTNIWLMQQFFDIHFKAEQSEENIKITVSNNNG